MSEILEIKVMQDGPIVLPMKVFYMDENGVPVFGQALCRCNSSNNKPYCDGSHTNGFECGGYILQSD